MPRTKQRVKHGRAPRSPCVPSVVPVWSLCGPLSQKAGNREPTAAWYTIVSPKRGKKLALKGARQESCPTPEAPSCSLMQTLVFRFAETTQGVREEVHEKASVVACFLFLIISCWRSRCAILSTCPVDHCSNIWPSMGPCFTTVSALKVNGCGFQFNSFYEVLCSHIQKKIPSLTINTPFLLLAEY